MNEDYLIFFQLVELQSKIHTYLIIMGVFIVGEILLLSKLIDNKTITLSLLFVVCLLGILTFVFMYSSLKKLKEVLNE